jgi:alkyl sulfatase BDS1-like metallo-beta-lactamase superfamily hydrolase
MPADYADRIDFDNAGRGLIAGLEPGQIITTDGRVVYDADIYATVTTGEALSILEVV